MGNKELSQFADQTQWRIITRSAHKELIQSKDSHTIYEKHILEGITTEHMKNQSLIYQWRNHHKTSQSTVSFVQMWLRGEQEDHTNCSLFCQTASEQKTLTVYTEHIHKLYQNNPRYQFTQLDQLNLFKELLLAIEVLANKFGAFGVGKEMVGYNSKKMGKAWINNNFAKNSVQFKRRVTTTHERLEWEASVIDSLVGFCQLCSFSKTGKNGKFSYLVDQIKGRRINSFDHYKIFLKKILPEAEQGLSEPLLKLQKRNSASQLGNKNSSTKARPSTKDCEIEELSRQSNAGQRSKSFMMVPVAEVTRIYPVSREKRDYLNQVRHTYHHPPENQSFHVQSQRQGNNYVAVPRQAQSFSADLLKRHKTDDLAHLQSFLQPISEAGESMANLSSQEASRRQQMCRRQRENIIMVDSMILVEAERVQSEIGQRRVILEESVVLRHQ